MRLFKSSVVLLGITVLSACAGDAESDAGALDERGDEQVAESAQAVTDVMYSWWTGDFTKGYELQLGSSANMTCFLVGVKGSLRGWSTWASTSYKSASAGVYDVDGTWRVRTEPGYGGGVAAKVGCIMTAANRVKFSASFWPAPSGGSVPATAGRQCFISAISGFGHGWTAFQDVQPNDPPGVGLVSDGINWRFASSLIENVDGAKSGTASAVCVDLPTAPPKTFSVDGPDSRILSLSNPDQYACGLQAIAGVFVDSLSDTPGIELFKAGSQDWHAGVADHYQATVRCAR